MSVLGPVLGGGINCGSTQRPLSLSLPGLHAGGLIQIDMHTIRSLVTGYEYSWCRYH